MKEWGSTNPIPVIGGGLAGCEAAMKLAQSGFPVRLYEMRPNRMTPAHQTGLLAELVCSNSLKSSDPATAHGLLKHEMRQFDSLILHCAEKNRVKAGSALAVEREAFAQSVTEAIEHHPMIEVVREELGELPAEGPAVAATGPLTSDAMAASIQQLTGASALFFFDAVAPILDAESLDHTMVFPASRYGKGEADYLNCPMNEEEYRAFYDALTAADPLPVDGVDAGLYFSGCMPIEAIAHKGIDTLRYGPMRPVGLTDPRTGRRPYAVLQLRAENNEKNMYSMVGFQTRMRFKDQETVFRLIPGLEQARFLRYGVMHRNTYINSPALLDGTLEFRARTGLFFAGQITGVEGYMESAFTGIIAGINLARRLRGLDPLIPPPETMIGSLLRHITDPGRTGFQPMNANFGLLGPLDRPPRAKQDRHLAYTDRSLETLGKFSEVFVNGIVNQK